MRYINLDKLRMPDGWLAKAATAKKAVEDGADLDNYSALWRELKSEMLLLSDTKCWYCESTVDRDDNAVDHYRPKNRVFDSAQSHTGYKWLAFEKSNFRLACTWCNSRRIDLDFGTSGGKADRFPLLDESKRVYIEGSIEYECPELLDPCDIDDCELIGCQQENGRACPSSVDPIDFKRAKSSIEIYHLDRDATAKRRHGVAVSLIADILDAKRLFTQSRNDASKKSEFVKIAKRIQSIIAWNAPYSGEMKYLLRGQRSEGHPWIQKLLEA